MYWVILLVAAAVVLYAIIIFNSLVRTRQMANEAWSGIDVQLKRRSELVPNLVESVKGYTTHERSVLEEVTRLRNAAREIPTGDVTGRAQAERALTAAIGKLVALAENYPDLKASANFLELQRELSQIEDELQMARRYYNGTVRNQNVLVQSFPGQSGRRGLRFRAAGLFRAFECGRARRAAGRVARTIMRGIRPAISKYIRAWPIFIFPLVLSGATTAFAVELIHSFDSTVRVAKDGELTVTEAIRVEADGREIRHGIYRDFPLTFKDAGGTVREVDFKLLGVERDGRPEKYSTTRQHGVVRIYAGSKDLDVPRGEHTYVFRYRTGRQVRWFDGKPELNWNVTGNFWRFPIFQANYNLELADGARPLRWTAYTGRLGARGGNWRATIDTSGALMVATTRPLAPGEGLTVVAELPSDAVDPLSESQLLRYRLYDNRAWIFAGVGLLVVFGYYFVAWRVVGRDPKGGVVIPLFHPPPNISPALANYIHDWGFGRDKWRAFTAAALSLAVRELLRFDDSSGTLALKATGKKAPGRLPVGERSVLDWVNGQGGLAIISDAHGASIAKVGDSFTKSIERENRNRFFRRNLGYVIAGLAMTAAAIGGVLVFGGLQDQDLAVLGGFVFFGFISGMFLVHLLQMFFAGVSLNGLIRGAMSIVFLAIFISIANSLLKEWSPQRTCRFASGSLGLCRELSILLRVGRRVCDGEWPVLLSAARADRARPTRSWTSSPVCGFICRRPIRPPQS